MKTKDYLLVVSFGIFSSAFIYLEIPDNNRRMINLRNGEWLELTFQKK